MKTYGTLTYRDRQWRLDVVPHIAIRIKRIFPRAYQGRTSTITIADTPEVARDLEWFLSRHPLLLDNDTRERLTSRARVHRETEHAIENILTGTRLTGMAAPAREPRDYQTQAADLAWLTGGLLLGDEVGLGKSFTSLLLLRDRAALPAVVVTMTHLPQQWLGELALAWPDIKGHIVTKAAPYPVNADVLILNYHKIAGWADYLEGTAKTVIFDEVQELRRAGTAKYNAAVRIAHAADRTIGLSASPVYNYGGEIHNIMEVLKPDALGSRAEFVREWGASEYGDDRIQVADPAALGEYLRDQGLLLRRTRRDVHREMPDPITIVHDIAADPAALDEAAGDTTAMARLILAPNTDHTARWRAAGELDMRMRQATGIAKAPYVAEFVRLLLESEEAVVLFGWHRGCYDIWARLLAEFNPVLYTGTESPARKEAAKTAFLTGQSRVLLMSLRAGAGLDGLQTRSSVAVFGELDWSPAIHHQCIGRLARDGQESTVAAYYLVTDAGSDPVIQDVLELKSQQAEPLLDPQGALFTGAPDTRDRVRLLAEAVLARTQTAPLSKTA